MSFSFRIPVIGLAALLALTTACTNKKVDNPLAKVDSKQPDKVLFDRGMDAMKHNRFDVARLDMQTLINTYPDSEFVARAKLSLADSWYAEGGTAALAQAETEYKDFETFFPNMPEAAEAQLKIANIHFQQMEKPDRDFTHAVRAEEEYRQVILQYPDNQKMVAEAKKRLLQVQEVIAEREFRVGRFYCMRQTYPAAIARLQSLVDRYPLYSKADETLYLLGQSYEGEIALLRHMDAVDRQRKVNEAQLKAAEAARERMITDFANKAAEAYSKILTRYPVMDRSDDAKARLLALHQPVPRPTKAALAQNKAEEAGRGERTMLSSAMGALGRHPDVTPATKVGDPTLTDQTPISASGLVQQANRVAMGANSSGTKSVTAVTTGTGAPPENEPAPRSDATPPETAKTPADQGTTQPDPNELKPGSTDSSDPKAASDPKTASDPKGATDPKTEASIPDPNELKPDVAPADQPAPAPGQVNEIQQGANGTAQGPGNGNSASSQDLADDKEVASSKHKKKKGLSKIIPMPKIP
jgi:outer membrane protein assembly factor BamD